MVGEGMANAIYEKQGVKYRSGKGSVLLCKSANSLLFHQYLKIRTR